MKNSKVKIKGNKQTLTLNGESFFDNGIKYFGVKEREYSIPGDQLIFLKK
jgi:hypothetical protein